jgi:MFS family permease
MAHAFRRDRLTWTAYVMLAWFAYLQAAPGLVIPHLRDELRLSYATGGLHVAAFAAGSMVAGLVSARLERALGRRTLLWSAAALMGLGAVGLTAGRTAAVTIGSVLVMGVGGGLLLVTIQATLADHHGEHRTVALTEANVAASIAYVVLIGVLSLTAALHAGWRLRCLPRSRCPHSRGGATGGWRSTRRRPGAWRRAASRACSGSRPPCCSARPRPSGASPPGVRPSSRTRPTCRRTPRSR